MNKNEEQLLYTAEAQSESVVYGVVKSEYILGEMRRVSYGIAAYANADEEGTAVILALLHDITSNASDIEALVERCNRSGLSLLHLADVVEDELL